MAERKIDSTDQIITHVRDLQLMREIFEELFSDAVDMLTSGAA